MGATLVTAGRKGQSALRVRQLEGVERTPLFQALPRRHRQRLVNITEFVRYDDGDVILQRGDPGLSFRLVLEGEVLVKPAQGVEHTITVGESFGELSLIDGLPRAATLTAIGPVTTGRIGRAEFLQLLKEEPGVAVALLPGVALIMRDLVRWDVGLIPDYSQLGDWQVGSDEPRIEADGLALEGRDALGWLTLVRHVRAFEFLPDRHLRHIARYLTIERFADGKTVVLAGAPGNALYIILGGCALVRTPSGRQRELRADDSFGELALLDGAPRAATVSALGDLTVAKMKRSDFQKILDSEPDMALGLLNAMVKTIRSLQKA